MQRVLVLGACGQFGSELSMALVDRHGMDRIMISDVKSPPDILREMTFREVNVLDTEQITGVIEEFQPTQIYHLAAILSAKGEKDPHWAWRLNMDGLLNVLELIRSSSVKTVFWPSSIAAFGRHTPPVDTPQYSIMDPDTVYGISKLSGELWCNYYHKVYGLDIRSLRYPGLISYQAPPGGGTTDYAIDIFHSALKGETFQCFLQPDTRLPMMYMPDAIKAAIQLMEAPREKITVRTSYNVGAMSFTPQDLANAISVHIPDFTIAYEPDYRQKIAATWPQQLDDSEARNDWAWKPRYSLGAMTRDMIENLTEVYNHKS